MKLTPKQTSLLKTIWENAKQYIRENRISIGIPIMVEDIGMSVDDDEKRVINQLVKKNLITVDIYRYCGNNCLEIYLTGEGAKFCYENL